MGIFDFLKLKQKKSVKKQISSLKNDKLYLSERDKLQSLYKRLNYPELPFLPPEIECKRIMESYQTFPASLVAKEYMTRNNSYNLLRGDFIILWWITIKSRDVYNPPQYFLYQYGINFENELKQLQNQKLITKNFRLTLLGREILDDNNKLIKMHKANKIYSQNGGPIKYELLENVNPNKANKKPTDPSNILKMNDYFYKESKRLESLWKDSKFENVEHLGINLINEGIMYPSVFLRMAMIYRKRKDYQEEIKILELAIQRQIEFNNTGVAVRNFEERLNRARKLQMEEKQNDY